MNYRYTVNISFVFPATSRDNIVQNVKTLAEALSFKSILDDTVKEAIVIDNISGKVCEWLKKNPNKYNY